MKSDRIPSTEGKERIYSGGAGLHYSGSTTVSRPKAFLLQASQDSQTSPGDGGMLGIWRDIEHGQTSSVGILANMT
jgi:hypothetical protein